MNELQRLAYLDAIGVDAHVSRTALPGAAPTRRLAIARRDVPAPSQPEVSAATVTADGVASLPALDTDRKGNSRATAPTPPTRRAPVQTPRFSLAAIVAGNWLWLEDLDGAPLAREQVWLVRSMAHAIMMKMTPPGERASTPAKPEVAQFDWPIHRNQQLDLGVDAARSAVAGFLGRKFREHACGGLVLLGDSVADWVPPEGQPGPVVKIAGTVEMLQRPAAKRDAWSQLVKLARS
jgi:hypothetical protein